MENILKSALREAIHLFKKKEVAQQASQGSPKRTDTKKSDWNEIDSAEVKDSRHVSCPIQREVWRQDGGRCSFIDPLTKRRCEGRQHLEYDHVLPCALGGKSDSGNLRLLCRAHNQLLGIQVFGEQKMRGYLSRRLE